MRISTILFVALALTTACSHSAPNETATRSTEASDGHMVASTPAASGGEIVRACGNGRVFFASGSSELDADTRSQLDTYAGCLTRHEADVVYVSGETDAEGTTEDNLALGRARARAVADHLHAAGCDADFVIRTYGETDAHGEPLWPLDRSATSTAVVTP